jgi:hypothetical protein
MAPEAGLAPAIYRFKGGCNTLCYSGNPFFLTIKNGEKIDGFEATMRACKLLGLDISNIPKGILQAFYQSGIAFAEDVDTSPDAKRRWRDSVLSPLTQHRGPNMKVICQIAKK